MISYKENTRVVGPERCGQARKLNHVVDRHDLEWEICLLIRIVVKKYV